MLTFENGLFHLVKFPEESAGVLYVSKFYSFFYCRVVHHCSIHTAACLSIFPLKYIWAIPTFGYYIGYYK